MRQKTVNIRADVTNFLIVLFNHAVHYKCHSVFVERDRMSF